MREFSGKSGLPPIPAKRYFTVGEVSGLCGLKPHTFRYWEREFPQLKLVKRRRNRHYYQHNEVMLIRKIRELLYDEGLTVRGARSRLAGSTEAENQCEATTRRGRPGATLGILHLIKRELRAVLNALEM